MSNKYPIPAENVQAALSDYFNGAAAASLADDMNELFDAGEWSAGIASEQFEATLPAIAAAHGLTQEELEHAIMTQEQHDEDAERVKQMLMDEGLPAAAVAAKIADEWAWVPADALEFVFEIEDAWAEHCLAPYARP